MHETITQIREALGLNKTQLAAKLECSPAMVTRLEDGDRNPGPELVRRLWDLTPPGELRRLLSAAVLEANGIPVNYETGPVIYRLTEQGEAARSEQ